MRVRLDGAAEVVKTESVRAIDKERYGGVDYTVVPEKINATTIGNTLMVAAPGAGFKVVITAATINNQAGADITVAIQSNTTDISGDLMAGQNGGGGSLHAWVEGAENEAINLNLSAGSASVSITFNYIIVAA